jgi:hypothetical protein
MLPGVPPAVLIRNLVGTLGEVSAQIVKLSLQPRQFLVGELLQLNQLITSPLGGPNQLVELEVDGLRISILSVLNNEDHQKGDHRRSGIDHQLPGIRKPEDRPGNRPHQNHGDGQDERPCRAYRKRDLMSESTEEVTHDTSVLSSLAKDPAQISP